MCVTSCGTDPIHVTHFVKCVRAAFAEARRAEKARRRTGFSSPDELARLLEPDETERLVVTFESRPMTRWQATIVYVRNPTALERWPTKCVDWLGKRGWAPSALREWRDGVAGGLVSTDWIAVPATDGVPTLTEPPLAGEETALPGSFLLSRNSSPTMPGPDSER